MYPAVWSFQLAARSRGLGSCFVAAHLRYADEVAQLLGLPEQIGQAGMVAVALVKGDGFRPARRPPLDQVVHQDRWQADRQREVKPP
ncbi:nitroreductase family protein [Sphaerisporangium sp. NPDC051017]|uniref:nitroreductase family protein n=1 Tax=Sphaerisporangium sp. NPDC051017 TaxID=3154636 RepID=UPI0034278EAD